MSEDTRVIRREVPAYVDPNQEQATPGKWQGALKAIVPALVTLVVAVILMLENGVFDAEVFKIALSGFLYSIIVYIVPNITSE